MEFPYGHGHHHHRPETNEPNPDRYPPPPQPGHHQPSFGYDGPPPGHQSYGEVGGGGGGGGYGYNPPPPQVHQYGGGEGGYPPSNSPYDAHPRPAVHHVSHEGGGGGIFGNQSRPQEYGGGGGYPPSNSPYDAPPRPAVQHVSHEGGGGGIFGNQSRPQEYGGSHVQHAGHKGGLGGSQPTVRIYTKAEESYSLSIRDGKVVLARADHADPYQHWIRDLKYSTRVKDEEGFPSFALVNKVTGQALKHSIGPTHPVRLVPYNPDYLDESVLWSESKDLGDGFRCIRMVNNIRLNFDAFHGDEDHGGVHDGTTVVLWEWLKGKNQRWKIVSYCEMNMMMGAYPK